jgi:hypothetical protein
MVTAPELASYNPFALNAIEIPAHLFQTGDVSEYCHRPEFEERNSGNALSRFDNSRTTSLMTDDSVSLQLNRQALSLINLNV